MVVCLIVGLLFVWGEGVFSHIYHPLLFRNSQSSDKCHIFILSNFALIGRALLSVTMLYFNI